jgi:hypothetical protein
MGELNRGERLQIMLTHAELRIVDTWRFAKRMPSRAAARSLRTSPFSLTTQPSNARDSCYLVEAYTRCCSTAAVCSVAPRF